MRDFRILEQVFKAEKAELFVPFWKRPKIEPIKKTRRKLAQMLSGENEKMLRASLSSHTC